VIIHAAQSLAGWSLGRSDVVMMDIVGFARRSLIAEADQLALALKPRLKMSSAMRMTQRSAAGIARHYEVGARQPTPRSVGDGVVAIS